MIFKFEQVRLRKIIKEQIEAGVPKNKLHFFSFSEEEYKQIDWTRQDKEFRLGNQMFDIVHVEKTNNSIQLYCINDVEETALFAHLDSIVRQKMAQESTTPNTPLSNAVKILKLVYLVEKNDILLPYHSPQIRHNFPKIIVFYNSPHIETLTPPPIFG